MKERIDLMSKDAYIDALQNVECSFAYHKAIFDDEGKMIDYIFLDVNKAFEKMTGLRREEVINKRLVADITSNRDHALTWVREYENIVYEKKMVEFEKYSEMFNKHFKIKAYYVEDDCFVTLFLDKTVEKELQEISEYFTRSVGTEIDYEKIAQLAHDITGAEVSVFNLFDKEGKDFTTLSIHAEPGIKKKALEIINQRIIGRTWPSDPKRAALTGKETITYFNSLIELTNGTLPDRVVQTIERMFDLGQSAVAKIEKDGKVFGDFNLIFKKGEMIQNEDLFRIYLSQLGLFVEKTRLLQALNESQKRFHAIAENAPVGFISCNTEGQIQYVNRKLLEIMDSPSYEATAEINLLDFPSLIEMGFSEKLREAMELDRQITHEMPYKSLWGRHSWLKVSFTPNSENGKVVGANILVIDITEDKKTEELLKEMAQRDSLTRAYNRHVLETIISDKLEKIKDNDMISCIVSMDIDNFKDINDQYGHRAGDKVLQYLAMRIKQELREDDLIVRTGGDEFLLYLHDIRGENNAKVFVDRIYKKITGSYRLKDDFNDDLLDLEVSCSIGVAFYPKDGDDIYQLMSKADQSLYKVKRSGKSDYNI